MDPQDAIDLGREAIMTALMVGLPVLLVGVLILANAGDRITEDWGGAVRDGLALEGWTDGTNVQIEYRWSIGADGIDLKDGAVHRGDRVGLPEKSVKPDLGILGAGRDVVGHDLHDRSESQRELVHTEPELAIGHVQLGARLEEARLLGGTAATGERRR